jgi:SAM-dependent methyltransferase
MASTTEIRETGRRSEASAPDIQNTAGSTASRACPEDRIAVIPLDSASDIKDTVRDKYGKIASRAGRATSQSAGDSGCCGATEVTCFADDYTGLAGYVPEADLGLGCGVPTEIARIKPGETVLDLGSGAGNDAFVTRAVVGETGRVIGVDMTVPMIEKAQANAARLGYVNVEFRLGEIESLPVESDSVDVVISNCVLNLVPDKSKAFSEIWRVLKRGGHFSISDIVVRGELPEALRRSAEAYVGCVAGAMRQQEYIQVISQAGFTAVSIAKEKELQVPDELLDRALPREHAENFKRSGGCLVSITVYGEKQ